MGRRCEHDEATELRHDTLAALLGIEAAARSLSRHRHLMTVEQVDELTDGLLAEILRLRSLIGRPVDRPAVPPPFELAPAVEPVIACARATGQVVDMGMPAGLIVAGDPDRTARVVLTLLANAARHAPGSPVLVQAGAEGAHVTLSVADRGPGVTPAQRSALFERGTRSAETGGAGLGLFVARRLMAEQGGALWFEPRPGGGSSFVLRLPRVGEAPADAPVARAPRAGVPSGRRRPLPVPTTR